MLWTEMPSKALPRILTSPAEATDWDTKAWMGSGRTGSSAAVETESSSKTSSMAGSYKPELRGSACLKNCAKAGKCIGMRQDSCFVGGANHHESTDAWEKYDDPGQGNRGWRHNANSRKESEGAEVVCGGEILPLQELRGGHNSAERCRNCWFHHGGFHHPLVFAQSVDDASAQVGTVLMVWSHRGY